MHSRVLGMSGSLLLMAISLVACSQFSQNEPTPLPLAETLHAVTADNQLISFNAGQPQVIKAQKPLTGLAAGEHLVGIDYRVARGQLYALSDRGQLYKLEVKTGALSPVGNLPLAVPLAGSRFGMDFNPVADRIRVVSNAGRNLRLHPDTGAVVDFDPKRFGVQPDPSLAYAKGDPFAGQIPVLVAAAYTYNKKNDKLTTNFAIDAQRGLLVTQGTREGVEPVVSPNAGQLYSVGALGIAGQLLDVAFDIADLNNAAYIAVRTSEDARTRLYVLDLSTGHATLRGTVGEGVPLTGMAIEP